MRRSTRTCLALAACLAGCAGRGAGPVVPTGTYELEASVGERTVPVRLELLSVGDGPWGRLTVVAGREISAAVRGTGVSGDAWTFVAGGPVRGLELRFGARVVGAIVIGDGPPIPLDGHRAGDVAQPEALRAHHLLEPLGLAARAGEVGVSFPTGTPDGTLIFARHGADLARQTLMFAAAAADGWRDPQVLALSGPHSDRSPAVLPDGSGIVFASDRPLGGTDGSGRYRLWFAARVDRETWGPPSPVFFDGGWDHDARQPSVTADGTLYFSSNAPGGMGQGDLYVASPVAPGRWAAPSNPGAPINGPGDEHGAFVAPDGSYMILTSAGERPGHSGGDDLYVSVRAGDGWTEPAALGLPVNTFANEYGAWVSPVDGHLYFTSDRYGHADIFRIEAAAAGLPGTRSSADGPDQEQVAERCRGGEHRQFDFWLGAWEVRGPDGALQGHNEITSVSRGCGRLERWRGARGGRGVSVNTYDAARGLWTQRWVGDGAILWLEGGLEDGRMVLRGTAPRSTPNGEVLDRLSWTPLPDGRVRQVWETSADGGATWREIFVGFYERAAAPEDARPVRVEHDHPS